MRDQAGQLFGWHHSAKIEQPVKPERPPDRIRDFEGEDVGQSFGSEAYGVLALEQRPKSAPDGLVFRANELDARILQRGKELARAQRESTVPDSHRVVVPEPFGADVIAFKKLRAPRGRVDRVSVPLNEEHVWSVDMRQQRLEHELRVGISRR